MKTKKVHQEACWKKAAYGRQRGFTNGVYLGLALLALCAALIVMLTGCATPAPASTPITMHPFLAPQRVCQRYGDIITCDHKTCEKPTGAYQCP